MRNRVRREMTAARRALDPREAERMSRTIADRIRTLDWYRRAEIVMIYRAVRGEVILDTLSGDTKTFCWPYIVDTGRIAALSPLCEDGWRTGKFGIPEPVPEKSRLILSSEIDLVICPCTAFDAGLMRMGMGGGYYDRFLPDCVNAKLIAAAYDFQRVEHIPSEPWDVAMNAVVTEKRVYI